MRYNECAIPEHLAFGNKPNDPRLKEGYVIKVGPGTGKPAEKPDKPEKPAK